MRKLEITKNTLSGIIHKSRTKNLEQKKSDNNPSKPSIITTSRRSVELCGAFAAIAELVKNI